MNDNPTTPAACPEDRVLFCPHCGVQHIDFAEPDKCENCGHTKEYHGTELSGPQPNEICLHCSCTQFVAWLNPPHKKHRCKISEGGCGELFKPEDYPTNGVKELATTPAEGLQKID